MLYRERQKRRDTLWKAACERDSLVQGQLAMAEKQLPGITHLTLVGIVLIVFGLICLAAPTIAGGAVTYVVGGLLVAAGALQLVQGIREPSLISKLLPVILGVVMIIGGSSVLARPLIGMAVLTLVLAAAFIVEGIWKIIASFSYRPAAGWIGLLLSGILAVILGAIIWVQWPISGLWAIGLLVGINLLFTGLTIVLLAVTVRRTSELLRGTEPLGGNLPGDATSMP